jgi:hypothetical protein
MVIAKTDDCVLTLEQLFRMDPLSRCGSKLDVDQVEVEFLVLIFILIGLVFVKSRMKFFVFTDHNGIVSDPEYLSLLRCLDQFYL